MRIYGVIVNVAAHPSVDLDRRPGHPIDVLPSGSSWLVSDYRLQDNPICDFLVDSCPIRDTIAISKSVPCGLDTSMPRGQTSSVKRQQFKTLFHCSLSIVPRGSSEVLFQAELF